VAGMWLAILLALAPAAPSPQESGDKRLWADCSNEGDVGYDRSTAACTTLIESGRVRGKDLGTAYYNRGTGHSRQGRESLSIADFNEAIRLNPKDVDALVNRGIDLFHQGHHRLAIADLDEAIRLDPREETALSTRANVYADLDDFPRAIADYSEVIRLNPKGSDAYYNRGLTRRRQGEDDKALADYDEAIRLDPSSSDVHNNRGFIYFRRGDLARAIADYKRAVVLRPANIEAQANLCWAMTLRGEVEDLDRARVACDSVLAIQDDLNTRVRRGAIAYRQGRFQQAWTDFDAAMRLDSGNWLPRYGRGLASRKLGRNADGDADIAAAISNRPGVAAEYESYGIPP
jgi:tetratricopeptide (TPR) repeat protein